jgi:hypothetical protein
MHPQPVSAEDEDKMKISSEQKADIVRRIFRASFPNKKGEFVNSNDHLAHFSYLRVRPQIADVTFCGLRSGTRRLRSNILVSKYIADGFAPRSQHFVPYRL